MSHIVDVHPGEIWENMRKEEITDSCKYVPLTEQLN